MKDFDIWNKEKKIIEKRNISKIKCHRRQIWLCKIGENIGSELSKGKPFVRPVLILETYPGGIVLIVPFTSKYNFHYKKYLFQIKACKYGLNFDSYLVLNQIRSISKKRLTRKFNDYYTKGKYVPLIAMNEFQTIKEKIFTNKIGSDRIRASGG